MNILSGSVLIGCIGSSIILELLIRNFAEERERIKSEMESISGNVIAALAEVKEVSASIKLAKASIANYEPRLHALLATPQATQKGRMTSLNQSKVKWSDPFSDSSLEGRPAAIMPKFWNGKPVAPTASLDKGSVPKPVVSSQVRPQYPKELRDNVSGSVNLQVIIAPDGSVLQALVKDSTNPLFEDPALNAIKHWKFTPGQIHGESVNVLHTVPIKFISVNSDTHWF